MAEFLNTLSNLFTLLFVVTSMLSMGLALTIPQIAAPRRNARLIVLARVRTPVRAMLENADFIQTIGADHICPSVEASAEALARTQPSGEAVP